MTTRVRLLALGLAFCLLTVPARAQVKAPAWKQGMELQVRKVGEKEFTKDTKKYGVEVYKDENTGKLVYISETGSVAVMSEGKSTGVKDKAPEWKHGMELQVRKAGEKEFTKDTKAYSIEVFYDPVNGSLIYISEIGNIAVVPVAAAPGESKDKAPTWVHAMELQARKAGEADFTKDTAKYGVEVFKDENNGNLIYISSAGSVSVVAAPGNLEKGKEFPWKYGMELRVRKAGEVDFNKDTKRWGVETFRDDNDGHGVYISEVGSIGVIAGLPTGEIKSKAPTWLHGMEMQARKAGEAEFTKNTKRYGVEVFRDENTANLVYATELGAVPVVGK
jgi:hypothetical protein